MPVEVVFTAKIRVKCLGISTGRRLVALSKRDAERLGFKVHDRVEVRASDRSATAIIVTSQKLVSPGEAAVSEELAEDLGLKDGDEVVLSLAGLPESLMYIRKKMRGQRLSRREIYEIVKDVVEHHLTELEIAAFLLAEEFHGMSMEEIEYLTRAMAETGQIVDFDRPVYDKHSIGGVPGNKVSLLIVPIVAASGLLIPKTSSKAITSPSGTANTMSMLAPVEFTAEELKEIALKAGGCIVWGGKLNIAPADDIFIEVEHPLGVDPTSQMLASIMSKKLAVGVDNLVIDIPVGRGTKAETISEGRRLAQMFVDLGKRVGIRVECGLTYGEQPVGHAVGPALEAREALIALCDPEKAPSSLVEKSTALAGMLLEMGDKAPQGYGKDLAFDLLKSGKALSKMREIIEAQGGDPDVKPEDIPVGQHRIAIEAPCNGYITGVDNSAIVAIARAAGAPQEPGAGLTLSWKRGAKVRKGDAILEIYAERESRLEEAYKLALKLKPITVEGMLLHRVPEKQEY